MYTYSSVFVCVREFSVVFSWHFQFLIMVNFTLLLYFAMTYNSSVFHDFVTVFF